MGISVREEALLFGGCEEKGMMRLEIRLGDRIIYKVIWVSG